MLDKDRTYLLASATGSACPEVILGDNLTD
jgi:hypothetical protein